MEKQITMSEVARAAADGLRRSLYLSMPGSVVAYYPNDTPTPTADVQPMVADVRFNLDTGAPIFEAWNVIQRVPVCFTRGGGFFVAVPLAKYDPVILEAWDLDPTAWRAGGRSGQPVNPHDVRRLGGNYWRCIPSDLAGPLTTQLPANAMAIGKDGDQAQIIFSAGKIQLGATGGDAVALASVVDAFVSALKTFASGVGGSPVTGSAMATAITNYLTTHPTTASSLIKAQ